MSQSQIAKELGVDRGTVALDILMEWRRRAAERPAERERAVALSVARREKVILNANVRLKQSASGDITEPKVHRAMIQCEKTILTAQHQIEQVLGLVPPAQYYSREPPEL